MPIEDSMLLFNYGSPKEARWTFFSSLTIPLFPFVMFLILSLQREAIVKWRQETQRLYEKSWIDADTLIFFYFIQILSRTASHGLPNFQRNRLPMAGKRDGNEIND